MDDNTTEDGVDDDNEEEVDDDNKKEDEDATCSKLMEGMLEH